jgi:hypothetical protein
MERDVRELVMLKLSHFEGFDNDVVYDLLCRQILDSLEDWIFYTAPDERRRLADITLGEYLPTPGRGAILLLVDDEKAITNRRPGFFDTMPSWASGVARSDLTVFDSYVETDSYPEMALNRIRAFETFDGRCIDVPAMPCEFFLLSWTLRQDGHAAFDLAMVADSHLADDMYMTTSRPHAV